MSELTAIDILINPDEATLDRAGAFNARLREAYPAGFALDTQHTPHITVLQRYVRTADLDQVYDAIAKVIADTDAASLTFTAAKIAHMPVGTGTGLGAVVLAPDPRILQFQDDLITAIAPFVESGGTAAAYVTDAAEPDINPETLHYIDNYVPEHSGPSYLAHVTIGTARIEDFTALEGEPFDGLAHPFRRAPSTPNPARHGDVRPRHISHWAVSRSEPWEHL